MPVMDAKPKLVQDIIESKEHINVPDEVMFVYAAWRTFAELRKRLDETPTIQTREQFLALLDTLTETYEGLYRACA